MMRIKIEIRTVMVRTDKIYLNSAIYIDIVLCFCCSILRQIGFVIKVTKLHALLGYISCFDPLIKYYYNICYFFISMQSVCTGAVAVLKKDKEDKLFSVVLHHMAAHFMQAQTWI